MKLQSTKNLLSVAIIGLAILSSPFRAQAEDPLLGVIRVVGCLGCIPNKVTLVVHDPIEIRDFNITISNSDYEKIVTPLPGKKIYDPGNGCFYWNEMPKAKKIGVNAPKTDSVKTAPPEPSIKNGKKNKKGLTKAELKAELKADLKAKKDALAANKKAQQMPDSSANKQSSSTVEPEAKNDQPSEQELNHSRCIPYEKIVEAKKKN